MTRAILVLVLLGVVQVSVSGCARKASPEPPAYSAPPPPGAENRPIRERSVGGDWDDPKLKELHKGSK
jgi:hypothetical protein